MQEMIDLTKLTAAALPKDLAYLGAVLVLLLIARLFKDLLTPYKMTEQLTVKDNPAVGMSVAGYYVGVLIVCVGPLRTPGKLETPWWMDLLSMCAWVLFGILLLNASRILVDKVVLSRFSTVKEIIEDKNVGTGAVELGTYIASGLIVSSSLQGQGGGVHTALAFFALGQVGLIVYGRIYMAVCRYDVHDEIEKDNVAAGVAFGLNLVAMGVVMVGAIAGDFKSWAHNLTKFGLIWVLGTVLLLALRWLVDLVLVPGAKVDQEIQQDRNLNAAWVEGVVLAGLAGLLVTIL